MTLAKNLDEIPRNNTFHGVNETIIEYLLTLQKDFAGDVFSMCRAAQAILIYRFPEFLSAFY